MMDTRLWGKAAVVLNQELRETEEDGLAVVIHYWGASADHRDNPFHKHSFFEVCYVLAGEGSYQEGGVTYSLGPGDLFVSRPLRVHRIRSRGFALLYVAFEVDGEKASPAWKTSFARLSRSERFLDKAAHETTTGLLWRALVQQAGGGQAQALNRKLAHLLLASLPGAFGVESGGSEQARAPEASSALLRQATLFIRDNLAQPLQLEGVAAYVHLSGRQLSRLFASELNLSFTAYVRMERVNQAARLLRQTDLSIKQIAEATGFGSVHYFTRVFAEVAGLTPAVFRGER